MNFLEKLDTEMQALGINKSKLSQLSGVPYTTIDGFYKKGYENAKISTIRKIASTLGLSLDYLVGDPTDENTKKSPSLSDEDEKFLSQYHKLDGDDRILIQGEIRGLLLGEKYQKDTQLKNA